MLKVDRVINIKISDENSLTIISIQNKNSYFFFDYFSVENINL